MRALVMAAGLGTRLRPLTDSLPKPLVPVLGRPMIEYALENLQRHGISEALLNVHYLPEKMHEFVSAWNARKIAPYLHVQDEIIEILGSGGAVAKAAAWLFEKDDVAVVCNSDVLGDFDISALLAEHRRLETQSGVECTLSVMGHPEAGFKYTGLRRKGSLINGFERVGKPVSDLWHFPGYYVISSQAAKRLPSAGSAFSIVERLWEPLVMERKLGAWDYRGSYYDLGTVADLRQAEAALSRADSE